MKKFIEYISEEKQEYVIKHKSYSSAISEAEKYAEKRGYTIEPDELFAKVGTGPKKPSVGKTNKITLTLLKNGKEQKKALHLQVTGLENGIYELNCYIL